MLITEKTYCFENSNGHKISAYIREFFTVESQTVFTWPCAILLASFISSADVVRGHSVVELGAGCGLPSIIAALSGAISCLITERGEEPSILDNLRLNVKKNGLLDICTVVSVEDSSKMSRTSLCGSRV
jgi:predicted nicotinamide N-methyase